jgi:hypothetical protein
MMTNPCELFFLPLKWCRTHSLPRFRSFSSVELSLYGNVLASSSAFVMWRIHDGSFKLVVHRICSGVSRTDVQSAAIKSEKWVSITLWNQLSYFSGASCGAPVSVAWAGPLGCSSLAFAFRILHT